MPVTSTLAAHSTHLCQTALLGSQHVLPLEDPSQTSAAVFPSSSIIILSDWILPVLSSPIESQATHNLTWSHIIITCMAEPFGSHEVSQTLAHSSKQTQAPDTSSCCFFKTNLTWLFYLFSLLARVVLRLLSCSTPSVRQKKPLSPPTSKQPPLILRAGLPLRL